MEKMKFTDMNIDCIESCLEHLKIEDLLNAAASNKRLNHAAKSIYDRKYHCRRIPLHIVNGNPFALSTLRYLRCFGELITRIQLIFYGEINQYSWRYSEPWKERKFIRTQRTIDYINEYCGESLVDIEFIRIQDLPEHFKKPFPRVKRLKIDDCSFSGLTEKNWLNTIFPRMQELHISVTNVHCEEVSQITFELAENHFAFLEHLSIFLSQFETIPWIVDSLRRNFMAALELNPQLKHLCVSTSPGIPFFDANDFQSVNLQNLESLEVTVNDSFYFEFNGESMRFRNLKSLRFIEQTNISYPIPFVADNLETLHLYKFVRMSEYEYDFIEKHPTITFLRLSVIEHVDLERIAKALPLLKAIEFGYSVRLTIDNMIPHWTTFESLKQISFLMEHIEEEDLIPLLIDGWSIDTIVKYSTKYEIKLKR
ncbi:uncharacterized protein LOC116341751 [Contarinia nasturtii]|uniref:uncharacterized protein LOC116341751 n=1 Tax=Contarinia nasturtii TaxID=265458 RepID=UPI0012D37758|nr:uncharacterized protein LOC116341751 [Contarinia nasturtii]